MKKLFRAATGLAALLLAFAADDRSNFRFAILGDRTGEAQPGVYEKVWNEVNAWRPDFVINAGDVIQGGSDLTAEHEWLEARAIWQRYRFPLYFTPGNHDIWSPLSEKLYEKYTGRPPSYSFDYRGAHFTILDNSRSEYLTPDQMKFLEQDLEHNRERNPKFVFFHRPLVWLIPLKFQNGDFALHQLARKYHVAVIVSGHTHQFLRMEQDGIVYLNAGSSGGHLRATDAAQGWYFGWVSAEVRGTKVDLTIKALQN